jgi:multicomponent Na+:H+ antiporter subunit F
MNYVIWAMVFLMIIYIVRAIRGPSIWDRLLALMLTSAKIIIIIVIYAFIVDISFLLDFAIIYALSGFIATIFIALFLSDRKIGKKRRGKEGGKDK